jgi:hypothetical protein
MKAKRYVKKPIVVFALQWTGNNKQDIIEFVDRHAKFDDKGNLIIKTLEGEMFAHKNDMIVKGIHNEFYPVKLDIFKKTYDVYT